MPIAVNIDLRNVDISVEDCIFLVEKVRPARAYLEMVAPAREISEDEMAFLSELICHPGVKGPVRKPGRDVARVL